MRRLCIWLSLCALVVAQSATDLASLRAGVEEIAKPGVPGPVALFGDSCFAVVAGKSGAARLAGVGAARYGAGRIVLFGHGGYFDRSRLDEGQTGRLFANALRWAAPDATAGQVLALGLGETASWLEESGYKVEVWSGGDLADSLARAALVCGDPGLLARPEEQARLRAFVAAGGGMVVANLGWGWLQLNPDKVLSEHPVNRLLVPCGLGLGDGYLEQVPRLVPADSSTLRACHATRALALLVAHDEHGGLAVDQLEQTEAVVMNALSCLHPTSPRLWPELRGLLAERQRPQLSEQHPLRVDDALDRLSVYLEQRRWLSVQPEELGAAPEASLFPGVVSDTADRVTRAFAWPAGPACWRSTGLYAAPGEVIEVQLEKGLARRGLRLRIGCHSDRLWEKNAWRRHPEISSSWPLERRITRQASPFGGLVYIEVPAGLGHLPLGLQIAGAVEAPFYQHGVTDIEAWQAEIRTRGAPWAELASDRIILSVPSRVIRSLDDPARLMDFWDRVLGLYAELGQRPLAQPPERMVCDVQISAGYMHSGYPIMTLLDVEQAIVSVDALTADSKAGWGFWHELGHNHQQSDWTFDGTIEVTCNLFTVFVLENLHGCTPSELPRLQKLWPDVRAYFEAGSPFATWKSRPFLALMMYMQVQEAFGWEVFHKVFAEYRDLPRGQRPENDAAKRDQWLVRLSRACGRDLGPFFERWGIPVTDEARAEVAGLEDWNPEPPRE